MIRAVLVELRRAVDSRAPRWAFAVAVLVGAGVALAAGGRSAERFADFATGVAVVIPLLMGLLAVMTFTGDWTTRAALSTFALAPRRERVLMARYIAILLLAVATLFAVTLVAAALFVAVHPTAAATIVDRSVVTQLGQMLATTVATTLTAVAVASLVLRTAIAILVAVVGPIGILFALASFPVVLEWLNPYGFASWLAAPTWSWLAPSDTSVGLGPALVSFAVWTALPLSLGWLRQMRAEPR